LLVAGLLAGITVALLGFVYLETKADLTAQSDRMIASQMAFFAHLSPERRDAIDGHLKQDPRMLGSRDCLARTAAGSRATWKAFRPIFRPMAR
jgi:hypothetical protein